MKYPIKWLYEHDNILSLKSAQKIVDSAGNGIFTTETLITLQHPNIHFSFWNMKSTIKQIFLPSSNSRSRSNSEAKRFLSEEFLFSKSDGVWRWPVWWKIFLSRYSKECLQLYNQHLFAFRYCFEIKCSPRSSYSKMLIEFMNHKYESPDECWRL